jgi:hypothetical protein
MPRAQFVCLNCHRASIAFYWIFEESWRNIFETTLATGPRFFPGIIILDLAEVQPGQKNLSNLCCLCNQHTQISHCNEKKHQDYFSTSR